MKLFNGVVKNLKIENEKGNAIYAPITGDVVPIEMVNDVVFSQKMMGDGVAILPHENEIYSPVSGTISVIFPTKHAIGITADFGAKVIMHIGIDTVQLKGDGFDLKVRQGDRVKAGQLLMLLDLKKISENYDPTTMVVIENSSIYSIEFTRDNQISAGNELMLLSMV